MKRRIISQDECISDLSDWLSLVFNAAGRAVTLFEKEIALTPPQSRSRGFEASFLNSKMIQCIQEDFPDNWKFGRYKRFILRLKGYNILFKKLNGRNFPMNIKTKSSDAIINQLQGDLFDVTNDFAAAAEPIVFFGYKKDGLGVIGDMKLVYIDENKVKWTVVEDRICKTAEIVDINKKEIREAASPRVKVTKRIARNE
jgi:hypothetical protein